MANYPSNKSIITIDSLLHLVPAEAVNQLGAIFETARENEDMSLLDRGLSLSKTLDVDKFDDLEKAHFYYNVANGFGYRTQLNHNPNDIGYNNIDIINEIMHIRLALNCCKDEKFDFLKSQLLVNLGNTFNHLGRCSEAITLWEQALESTPNFGMATGNLGYGVFFYGKAVYDEVQQIMFFQYAHNTLKEAIKSKDIYTEAKNDFVNLIESIQNVVGEKNLNHIFNISNHSLGKTKTEQEYRQWVLTNKLFINPLNDIYNEPVAAHDCMSLPPIVMRCDEPMIYHDLFNQIKQEFVSARYFIYKGLFEGKTHFSDKGNTLVDTSDYAYYSLNVETLKVGFRMCYSIFDKIALFLKRYYEIDLHPDKVNFSKIWYLYDKKGKPIGLREQVLKSENWILRGLYWLSRDIYSKDLDTADPEASDIAKIRNFIEHKSLKVVEFGEFGEVNDGMSLVIERAQFAQKCIKIIKLVRSAIMYLGMSVHISEESKKRPRVVLPYECITIGDDCKY